jgi:hypothetical protein
MFSFVQAKKKKKYKKRGRPNITVQICLHRYYNSHPNHTTFLLYFRLFAEGNITFQNFALLTTALNINLFFLIIPALSKTNLFTKSSV